MACKYHVLFIVGLLFAAVVADQAFEPGPSYIYDQIYSNLGTPSPCVRLLDKDDQFGCTSPQRGSVGSLYVLQNEKDLKALSDAGSFWAWVDAKVVVLDGSLFNREIIQKLNSIGSVAGVLVLSKTEYNNTRPANLGFPCDGGKGFSPADKHPNKQWGLYPRSTRQWNLCGYNESWLHEDQPFPIFALDYSDSKYFLEKAEDNKKRGYSWPKWSAELNSFMWASENSETCLRRGHCDPMGGQSVWSGMGDSISSEKKVILAMTQADSNAFFHDMATGGDAHAASIVALMTAAQAIASWRASNTTFNNDTKKVTPPTFKKELLFGFWTGESWGYLGSRKFVWDVNNFKCDEYGPTDYCKNPYKFSMAFKNLSLSRVDAIVELDQIGLVNSRSPKLYVHREGRPENTNSLFNLLNHVSLTSGVDVEDAGPPQTWEIPPSSMHSFLRANRSLPGVVLAEYKDHYANNFYQSRWDDATNVGVLHGYESVCIVANYVARVLWSLAMDGAEPPHDLRANCSAATMYMDCLVQNNTCAYKRELLGLRGGPAVPTHYTGVFRRRLGEITLTSKFLYEAMSVITSTQAYMPPSLVTKCNTTSQCPQNQNMQCQLGLCRNASTFYHDAVSLGLKWQTDSLGLGTGSWVITDSNEPLYTEARWDTTGVRVFMADNYLVEVVVLCVGVVEFLVFLVIFWYIRVYMLNKQ